MDSVDSIEVLDQPIVRGVPKRVKNGVFRDFSSKMSKSVRSVLNGQGKPLKGVPGSKNGPKSTRSSQGIGPGSHLGTVLCSYTPFSPFWLHFGSILEASWADSWSIWLFFGVVL